MDAAYPVSIEKLTDGIITAENDSVAIEEPLEIRLGFHRKATERVQPISITMRTPGDDFALAVGFLLTEHLLDDVGQIADVKHCGDNENVVRVDLQPDIDIDLQKLQRNFYVTSSCGICGKSSIEALDMAGYQPVKESLKVSSEILGRLPAILGEDQPLFHATGGNHGCAFVTPDGTLVASAEDVGRHNALDKLIGRVALKGDARQMEDWVLVLSGRASFELIQKSISAGVQVVAAVGAPSSLAVETARAFGQTLVGFVRPTSANVYCGIGRLA